MRCSNTGRYSRLGIGSKADSRRSATSDAAARTQLEKMPIHKSMPHFDADHGPNKREPPWKHARRQLGQNTELTRHQQCRALHPDARKLSNMTAASAASRGFWSEGRILNGSCADHMTAAGRAKVKPRALASFLAPEQTSPGSGVF